MKINVGLILLGLFLFNMPFISMFEKNYNFLFIPLLIFSLFFLWLLFIGLLYKTYNRKGR